MHREYYRLHSDVIELSKISELLLASEKGQLHEHQGITISDMTMDSIMDDNTVRTTNEDDFLPSPPGSDDDEPSPKKKKISESTQKDITDYFQEDITEFKIPGKKKCLAYIAEKKANLEWNQVKVVVQACVQKMKRQRLKGKDKF